MFKKDCGLGKLFVRRQLSRVMLVVFGVLLISPLKSYGTREPFPVRLNMELAEPAIPGEPITLLIEVTSTVHFDSGVLTLNIPVIENDPSKTIKLWSGGADELEFLEGEFADDNTGLVVLAQDYIVSALPIGEFEFLATVELIPSDETLDKVLIYGKLNVDVGEEDIVFSSMSFRPIPDNRRKNITVKVTEKFSSPQGDITGRIRANPVVELKPIIKETGEISGRIKAEPSLIKGPIQIWKKAGPNQ